LRVNVESYVRIVEDQKILIQFINNEKIMININIPISDGYDWSIYIKRKFNYRIQIKANIFSVQNNKSLLVISGTNKDQLIRFALSRSEIRLFEESDPNEVNPTKFIILEDHQTEDHFKDLCKNIHNVISIWSELNRIS